MIVIVGDFGRTAKTGSFDKMRKLFYLNPYSLVPPFSSVCEGGGTAVDLRGRKVIHVRS